MALSTSYVTAILIVFSLAISCKSQTCCTRSRPIEALNDGLYLQKLLVTYMSSEHKDLWFLPNAPELIGNKLQRKVVEDLLILVKLRDSMSELKPDNETSINETSISEVAITILMDAVINDSCTYMKDILDVELDCNNVTEVESLLNKLKFTNAIIHLYDNMEMYRRSGVLDFPKGRRHHRYSYWKVNVEDTCDNEMCPDLEDISDSVFRFFPHEKACNSVC